MSRAASPARYVAGVRDLRPATTPTRDAYPFRRRAVGGGAAISRTLYAYSPTRSTASSPASPARSTAPSPLRTLSPARSRERAALSPGRTLSTGRTLSPKRSGRPIMSPGRQHNATLAFGARTVSGGRSPAMAPRPATMVLSPRRTSSPGRRASPARSSAAQPPEPAAADATAGALPLDAALSGVLPGAPPAVSLAEQRQRVSALEAWAEQERRKLVDAERQASRPHFYGDSTPHSVVYANGLGKPPALGPSVGPVGIGRAGSAAAVSGASIRESMQEQNAIARRRLTEDRAMRRAEAARNAESMRAIFNSSAERVAVRHRQGRTVSPGRSAAYPYDTVPTSVPYSGDLPRTPPRDRQTPQPAPQPQPAPEPEPEPEPKPEPEPEVSVSSKPGTLLVQRCSPIVARSILGLHYQA